MAGEPQMKVLVSLGLGRGIGGPVKQLERIMQSDPYTHSPARITGSDAPEGVIPSMSM